jgi:predicted site-specific integrase-resolvase
LCVPNDRLLTPAEAAKAIGVGRATLAKWARQGKVTPTTVLPNGDRRWDLDDLKAQLRELAQRERDADD